MKYQIGDRILVLHSSEEGEIVEIINKDMVLIEVEGVRFPVYNDQIDFPYFKRFSEKKNEEKKKEKKYIDSIKKDKYFSKYRIAEGVWLSFLPVFDKKIFEEDVVEYFKLYLVNQTDLAYYFRYFLRYSGAVEFELRNELWPLSDFYIHDVPFEQMNDTPKFEFEFSLVQPEKKKAAHYETSLKIRAKQLFQRIEEIRMKNEPIFSYMLFEKYPDESIDIAHDFVPSPENFYDASKGSQNFEPPRSVVDLHIEKIAPDWKKLSNYEMLMLQLSTFEKYYQLALTHHQPNLIVIHGLGTGKLREEIHEILKSKPEVKSFVNQYHPNFGYGATEIYFQY
jgi:Smr domain